MASRREVSTVYLAGLAQGLGLVTFPAASAVLTDPQAYALSSAQYGGIFVPQAIMAIAASLLGARLRGGLGTKGIYLFGLSANLFAMILLVASRFVLRDHSLAYLVLLLATTCMGVGFGFTVPALNTLAAAFFPERTDGALLWLNALLGLGTALAPAFIALFVRLGIWWGLPTVVGLLLIALLLVSLGEELQTGNPRRQQHESETGPKLPARFWIFAFFVLLYGICETMNGNWASLYMTKHFGASAATASLALALFWSMITAGRITFALLAKWLPEKFVCVILPFIVAAAFITSALAPADNSALGLLIFALAGLGCSALLPLAISFGQAELTSISASVAGGLIAFYQIGYGFAAFGVGPLQRWVKLSTIYGGTCLVALGMAVLAFLVIRHQPEPR